MNKTLVLALFSILVLFGCLGQGQQTKNESLNRSTANVTDFVKNTTEGPVVNGTENTSVPPITPSAAQQPARVRSRVSASILSATSKGLNSFNITLAKVELHGENGWITLSSDVKPYDLIQIGQLSVLHSESSVQPGKFDSVRLTWLKQNAGVTTVSAIPGVVSTKKTLPVEGNLSGEAEFSGTVESNGTYILSVIFDLDSSVAIFEDKILFDANKITASLGKYSECRYRCVAICDNDVFPECDSGCRNDVEAECNIKVKTDCQTKCCAPDCTATAREECRINCISKDLAACIANAPSVCRDRCTNESKYVRCMDGCLAYC